MLAIVNICRESYFLVVFFPTIIGTVDNVLYARWVVGEGEREEEGVGRALLHLSSLLKKKKNKKKNRK